MTSPDDAAGSRAADADGDRLIGASISRYRILARLGSGATGVVYDAEDQELGRRVAVKLLAPEIAGDPVALDRFKREARAASALSHPHICAVHDVGVHEGQPYLVMERTSGQTLHAAIAGQPLAVDRVLALGEQIADALDAAHRTGIVHRDLKPANLFVTDRGDAKILDFGMAKRLFAAGPDDAPDPLTGEGVAVGTVAYMSPEQARGEPVDARSDLFSFGVVLYEMLTGRLPFEGESTAERWRALLSDTPAPPSRWNPAVPPALDRIVLQSLAKEPRLRYQSAATLRANLEALRRDGASEGPLSRLLRAVTPKRIADVLAPELTVPTERTLAVLKMSEQRRGESYWGARPAPGLAQRLLDVMSSRATHTGLRAADAQISAPASRPRARVASLTEMPSGRWAAAALLAAVVLALGAGLWLDARATAGWVVGPVVAYLVWDVLLSSAIWVQINSRRLRSGAPSAPARTLTPRVLRARHAVLFFVHKLNYFLHLFRGFVYLAFLRNRWVRRATEEEIEDHCVEILIGSSYAIFLAQPAEHAGTTVFVLDLKDQAISHEIGKFDNRLRVVVDAAARRILGFAWNGVEVSRWSERLQILCDIGSQSIHPKIHSFNALLYADVDRVDRKYDRIFRHGQNLNNAAHHYPALCLLCPPRWFKTVLEANGAAPIPFHGAATLGKLAPHSPYVRFMLAARGAYRRLVQKHDVGVNAEAFFICSAMHSVDHAVYGALQDRVDFPGKGNNLVYRWFHLPVSIDWFMNNTLRENRNETPFYAELYDALHAVDPEYADMIDLSISN